LFRNAAHKKEVFMDETTGPEESGKPKDKATEIKETASAAVNQARRTAEAAWDEAKNKISDLQSLQALIREDPIRAVLIAFGIGVLTGLLWRRVS
jgi:ElaB/YqjD/DUF883 family membrane-anchored ribosome-binding protein